MGPREQVELMLMLAVESLPCTPPLPFVCLPWQHHTDLGVPITPHGEYLHQWYTPYEGPESVNLKDGKLVAFLSEVGGNLNCYL